MNAWENYGSRLYLPLLHANFLDEPAPRRGQIAEHLLDAATAIADQELDWWFCSGAWREMLTAGWIVGLARRSRFYGRVREKLLSSSTCFAGQGLCFAMARFESDEAAEALCEYLRRYLPVGEREYDQEWAIGALEWLDYKMGTNRARAFADDPQLWITSSGSRQIGSLDPRRGVETMRAIMSFVEHVG